MTHQKIEKLTVGIPNQYQLIGSKERNQFRKYNSSLVFQNFYMYTAVSCKYFQYSNTEYRACNIECLLFISCEGVGFFCPFLIRSLYQWCNVKFKIQKFISYVLIFSHLILLLEVNTYQLH